MQISIEEQARDEISEQLQQFLTDSYALYLKTQNYHWNVTGPQFSSLHALFEEQYTELAAAIDELAERIRSLGHYAEGGLEAYAKDARVEDAAKNTTAMDMVSKLLKDHERLVRDARSIIEDAEEHEDQGTADLLTARAQVHEKTAWMLRSHLE